LISQYRQGQQYGLDGAAGAFALAHRGTAVLLSGIGLRCHFGANCRRSRLRSRRINRADKLPLLVDADHGYGNALSVKRTVEELETPASPA